MNDLNRFTKTQHHPTTDPRRTGLLTISTAEVTTLAGGMTDPKQERPASPTLHLADNGDINTTGEADGSLNLGSLAGGFKSNTFSLEEGRPTTPSSPMTIVPTIADIINSTSSTATTSPMEVGADGALTVQVEAGAGGLSQPPPTITTSTFVQGAAFHSDAQDSAEAVASPSHNATASTMSWNGFFGQSEVVRRLSRHIDGWKGQGLVKGAILITGKPGNGKSALARAAAKEIGTECHILRAGEQTTLEELTDALSGLKPGDVLFIDEAHALKKVVQEAVMQFIDDQSSSGTDGKSNEAVGALLVLATDQPGKLQRALRSRMEMTFHLGDYSIHDLILIGSHYASKLGICVSPQGIRLLCQMSRGTPRRIEHLLKGLARLTPNIRPLTKDDVREYLVGEGIDTNGNEEIDRLYLRTLHLHPALAISALALQIGIDAASLTQHVEPRLIALGLMTIMQSGRCLTESGNIMAAEYADNQDMP